MHEILNRYTENQWLNTHGKNICYELIQKDPNHNKGCNWENNNLDNLPCLIPMKIGSVL